ncbi:carbohydrate sulfotransferase 14 [Platysternon megacephalum]|uniref:Carbohydrate sulfotransferase 14 n=1 Tax=Platysternon megacephalum TaxID=55544 RepID=A0A4D9F3A2_9SAUR|nr:carbohydrate sulfotransferase 14 [Platysternon megacephalum]
MQKCLVSKWLPAMGLKPQLTSRNILFENNERPFSKWLPAEGHCGSGLCEQWEMAVILKKGSSLEFGWRPLYASLLKEKLSAMKNNWGEITINPKRKYSNSAVVQDFSEF